jgi:hypothetical protein
MLEDCERALHEFEQCPADDPEAMTASGRPAQNELIWRTGVEEIHIDCGQSGNRFKKPLRDNDGPRQ